jgi:integrase
MEIRTKTNGIKYLDLRLQQEDGTIVRSRVSLDTRDEADAKAQAAAWMAGTHPKHPAQASKTASKKRSVDAPSTGLKSRSTGMTLSRWLFECEDTLWKGAKGRKSISSNIRILRGVIDSSLLLADVNEVTIYEIEKALRERHPYAEGTMKKLMGALSASLGEAVRVVDPTTGKKYLTAKPPTPKYTVRNIQERTMSYEEEEAAYQCVDKRRIDEPSRPWWLFKAFMVIALDTGFRMAEVLSLGPSSPRTKRWLALDGTAMEAQYMGLSRYATKTDKPREVPITSRVATLLPGLNALAVNGKWFPWKPGGSGIWYMWDNIRSDMMELGFDVSDLKVHTFRHTCGTRLAVGGMDLIGIRDWLGHSDISITAERYIHLMSSHLYRGVAILEIGRGAKECEGLPKDTDGNNTTIPEQPVSGNHSDSLTPLALH